LEGALNDLRVAAVAGLAGSPRSRRALFGALVGSSIAAGPVGARRRQVDHTPGGRVHGKTAWREIGDTTLETFESEFARLGSPMLDEAAAIYRRVRGHSALFLAMSFHEKKHDTYLGIIPAHFHNAMAMKADDGSGRWRRYPRYEAGAAAWVKRLISPTGPYAHTVSLRQLIMVYAPPFENDVRRYVRTVSQQINSYPRLPPPADDEAATDLPPDDAD
jgi:hypothetical protein